MTNYPNGHPEAPPPVDEWSLQALSLGDGDTIVVSCKAVRRLVDVSFRAGAEAMRRDVLAWADKRMKQLVVGGSAREWLTLHAQDIAALPLPEPPGDGAK